MNSAPMEGTSSSDAAKIAKEKIVTVHGLASEKSRPIT